MVCSSYSTKTSDLSESYLESVWGSCSSWWRTVFQMFPKDTHDSRSLPGSSGLFFSCSSDSTVRLWSSDNIFNTSSSNLFSRVSPQTLLNSHSLSLMMNKVIESVLRTFMKSSTWMTTATLCWMLRELQSVAQRKQTGCRQREETLSEASVWVLMADTWRQGTEVELSGTLMIRLFSTFLKAHWRSDALSFVAKGFMTWPVWRRFSKLMYMILRLCVLNTPNLTQVSVCACIRYELVFCRCERVCVWFVLQAWIFWWRRVEIVWFMCWMLIKIIVYFRPWTNTLHLSLLCTSLVTILCSYLTDKIPLHLTRP